jgi:hypothetical protein
MFLLARTSRRHFQIQGARRAARSLIAALAAVLSTFTLVAAQSGGAPSVLSVTSTQVPVEVDTSVSVTASFSDADGNTSGGTIDWGDGSTSAASVDGASGTASGSHSYAEPGVHKITVTLTDDDGNTDSGSFEYVVVYDPDGGFVTGGGQIISPPGACKWTDCDETTTGPATFGFVSRYTKNQGWHEDDPSGNTTFRFQAGGFEFGSVIQDWLVVAGQDKAKYMGSTGQVDSMGAGMGGDFGYMVTVVDNGNSGDTFRIKIWDNNNNGEVVYDNKMGVGDDGYDGTEISSGNIKVHKK